MTNSNNPFKFNESSNEKYMRSQILVFRRTFARVERELFVDYCTTGLLDPNHTIGKPGEKYTGDLLKFSS